MPFSTALFPGEFIKEAKKELKYKGSPYLAIFLKGWKIKWKKYMFF